jgi:hypothetical protein
VIYFVIRTEAATGIPLRVCSFHRPALIMSDQNRSSDWDSPTCLFISSSGSDHGQCTPAVPERQHLLLAVRGRRRHPPGECERSCDRGAVGAPRGHQSLSVSGFDAIPRRHNHPFVEPPCPPCTEIIIMIRTEDEMSRNVWESQSLPRF